MAQGGKSPGTCSTNAGDNNSDRCADGDAGGGDVRAIPDVDVDNVANFTWLRIALVHEVFSFAAPFPRLVGLVATVCPRWADSVFRMKRMIVYGERVPRSGLENVPSLIQKFAMGGHLIELELYRVAVGGPGASALVELLASSELLAKLCFTGELLYKILANWSIRSLHHGHYRHPLGIEPALCFSRLRDSSAQANGDGAGELSCCLARLHTLVIADTQVHNLGFLLNCAPNLGSLKVMNCGDFQVGDCEQLHYSFEQLASLTSVTFSRLPGVTDIAVGTALRRLKYLKFLSLNGCKGLGLSFAMLGDFGSSLVTLNVKGLRMDDSSCAELGAALDAAGTPLRELAVGSSQMHMGDSGIAALLKSRIRTTLLRLELSMFRGLTDDGLNYVVQCTHLRSLAVVWCNLLSDGAEWSAIAALRRLESVSVRNCSRIGDPTLPKLLRTTAVHGSCRQLLIDAKATRVTARGKDKHESNGGGTVILD